MINALQSIFKRDLERLKTEISLFKNEATIWKTDKQIANAAGNLCLHVLGNLNAYIGAVLAKTGYVRNRELEFSAKNIARAELLQRIEATILVVERGLGTVTEEQLRQDFPVVIWDKPAATDFTLIHLATHLNYHLGQINYHRRLLDA